MIGALAPPVIGVYGLSSPAASISASELPAVPSQDAKPPTPVSPTGDFSRGPASAPRPAGLFKADVKRTGFDPQRSRVVDSLTTAQRQVFENPDGSRTAKINSGAVRFKDATGAWTDIDLSLVPGADGLLRPKASPRDTRVSDRSSGDLAVVPTSVGDFRFTVEGMNDAPAVAADRSARYANALGLDRNLAVTLLTDGFEDQVDLLSPTASNSYRVEFTVPGGVTARMAAPTVASRDGAKPSALGESGPATTTDAPKPTYVEFVDGSGAVVGTYGFGVASDAKKAFAEVTSALVGQSGHTVSIENSVDPAWLTSKDRVFPVTIDPYGLWNASTVGTCPSSPMASPYNVCDTYTNQGTPDTPYASASYMWSGCPCYPTVFAAATWLQFPTDNMASGGFTVLDASISLRVSNGQPYYRDTRLYGSISPVWQGLTWNNQVGPGYPDNYYGVANYCGCGGTNATWNSANSDVVALVQEWFDGRANDGVLIYPDYQVATDPTYFREYFSAEAGAGLAPTMTVTYNRPPVVSLVSPANGTVLSGTTPTLTASGSDPDGTALSYDFALWDASTGAVAWDSGWTGANSVTVPAGKLSVHHVYNWQVAATDGTDISYSQQWSISEDNPPGISTPSSPDDGAVVLPNNVVLTVNPASDPDGDAVQYYFQVTSNAGTGAAITSGFQSSTSFTVPAAALKDGTTYTWQAWTSDGYQVTSPNWSRTFKVDRRLGIVGPLPYDTAGPAAVNLFNGNLVVRSGSPSLPTVGGGVGLSYTYNSEAPLRQGLTGSYYTNCTNPAIGSWPSQPSLVRLDPQVSFNWAAGSPGSMISNDNFCVRWVGYITPSQTGSYTFGAAADQGVKVTIGSGTSSQVVLDDWSTAASPNLYSPTLGTTSVALTAGQPTPITVEYYDGNSNGGQSANAFVNLYEKLSVGGAYPVDPSWLTPDAPALSQGWSLSVDLGGASTYTAAQPSEGQVTLVDATGATHVFKANGSEYTSPADDPDSVLARDANGLLTLQRPDGSTYVFGVDGTLSSLTFATDDRNPAATQLSWTGSPSRLRSMTDPVSSRSITLDYGGDQGCGTPPSGSGLSVAPTGMLCHVHYWNGTDTYLWYDASGRLTRIVDPGSVVSDFGYDSNSRVTLIRDPRVADWCAVDPSTRCASADTSEMTVVSYDASNRVSSVRLPKAQPSDTVYPSHSYTYVSGTRTRVNVAGLSPASGYARQVDFDSTGRLLTDTDATGVTHQATWDPGDRPLSATDAAGRVSNTLYDPTTKLRTDVYGPAVASCFNGQVPTATCQSTVAHTHTNYDEGINGLAAVYFPNLLLKGAPKVHSTGVGRGAVNPVSVDTTGALAADWGASGTPDASLSSGGWSGRYTGDVTMPAVGTYQLQLNLTGYGRLYVDDTLMVDSWTDTNGLTSQASISNTTAGARHRIRVEFRPGSSGARLELRWTPPGSSAAVVPGNNLSPRYGLVTSTTSDDATAGSPAVQTALGYNAPEYGLATSSTIDPNGQALVTTSKYEPSAAGNNRYLRPVAHWLPAANVNDPSTGTSLQYYGADTAATAANPCTGGAAVDQGGALWRRTKPDPDGAGPGQARVEESVYDSSGRVVASRVGTDGWTCLTYDSRGRTLSTAYPAANGQPARTVTHNYAIGGNPLVSSITDPAGTITTTVDLLGRVVSYTDVWGKTATTSYDQAGRVASVVDAAGTHTFVYDDAGRVTVEKVDGQTIATAAYVNGELSSATYPSGTGNAGNGTSLAIGRAANTGRVTDLTWAKPDQSTLTSDSVAYSQSGRVVDETIDGADARPNNPNFVYDTAGRLTGAWVTGHTLSYTFSGSGGCGVNAAAGKNTNRTAVMDNTTTTTYCYDNADRLTSTTDGRYGTISYDGHGNTTVLGGSSFTYDIADRQLTSQTGDNSLAQITNVAASVGTSTATITWTTDQQADSAVDYGATPALGTTVSNPSLVTSHTLTLTGLTCGDAYNYRVRSTTARSIANASAVLTLVTQPCPQIQLTGTPFTDANNAGQKTLTLNNQAGDFQLLTVLATGTAAVPTPTNWTLVPGSGSPSSTSSAPAIWAFYKVAGTTTESVTYGATAGPWRANLAVYRNVDTTSPLIDSGTSPVTLGTSSTSADAVTLNASAGAELVVVPAVQNNTTTGAFTYPASMVQRADNEATLNVIGLADERITQSAPTGTRHVTFTKGGSMLAWDATLRPTTDTVAPSLTTVSANAGIDNATVTWTTNEPATTVVEYGPTSGYGSSSVVAGISTGHQDTVKGLICGTTYQYRVRSADAVGNLAVSAGTFTTLPCRNGITLVYATAAKGSAADSVSLPFGGVRAGDRILVATTGTRTAPAGYDLLANVPGTGSTISVFGRTADGTETGVTVSGVGVMAGAVAIYRGVDQTTPGDGAGTGSANATSSVPASPFTPTSAHTELVQFGSAIGNATGGTWSFTNMVKEAGTDSSTGASVAVGDQAWPTASTTGTRTASYTSSASIATWLGALRLTQDATAPTVTMPSLASTATTASVTWTTNEQASGFVDYGATSSYDGTVGSTNLNTSQSVSLANLICGTTYHYRVRSVDIAGNAATSGDATFTTTPCAANAGQRITTFTRDALDRIVARTVDGVVVRYAYCGGGDSPCATLDSNSNVVERTVGVLGGALVTKRSTGDVWSYPNIHGDIVATADAAGVKQGATIAYDPYGQSLAGAEPDNSAGNFDYGWLGQHERGTDHQGADPFIEMGARVYAPGLGRFLETDPVPGGSANDYDYCNADPVNCRDLNGQIAVGDSEFAIHGYALVDATEWYDYGVPIGCCENAGAYGVYQNRFLVWQVDATRYEYLGDNQWRVSQVTILYQERQTREHFEFDVGPWSAVVRNRNKRVARRQWALLSSTLARTVGGPFYVAGSMTWLGHQVSHF